MSTPEKSINKPLSEAEVDALYGLEPALGTQSANADASADAGAGTEPVVVHCPYCGEGFETSADVSAGPCKYVEDCQVCCQPIEMELRVDENGGFGELLVRRGDS